MATQKNRRNFGKKEKPLPELNLAHIQLESWQEFLNEGVKTELAEVSPIEDFTGKNWEITLENPVLEEPKITSREAIAKGLTYSSPLKISATLTNKRSGKMVTQDVFLGDLPQMTSRGTFIVNGVERAVINQIVRSPGVYFSGDLDTSSGRILYMSEVRPSKRKLA